MGAHRNISIDKFPEQGRYLNHRTSVCFIHGTNSIIEGTIVRDDNEDPYITIIRLDDGRYVLHTECLYSPKAAKE